MEQFLQAETLIIELLLVVSLVAIAVQRLRVPYTVALVVVGLLITFQSPLEIDLTPELILALFVPPLIFEAAFHLNLAELRRNLPSILVLAVPGVLLTTLIVGGLVAWVTPLSLPVALVFGALIAATDPVAVVALFRTLGVPKRLAVLMESESLLNDGTAIVVFNLVLVVALTGRFNLVEGVTDFVRVAAGGTVVGLALGWIVSRLIARVDDYLIETTLTTVLAFGAYLVAERLHFSGVLAVVAAGLVNGSIGPQGMSPTTRIVLFNFWEYVAFMANSLVFLLIGLQVNIPALAAAWQPVLWAIVAVLAARVIVVYVLGWLMRYWTEPISLRWQHVLTWGGLRGAISLALALSLPSALGADRDLIRVMAFGVVLFTLLGQATTMRPLIRWLRIITRGEAQVEYEMRHARLTTLRAADARLDRLHAEGLLSTPTWEKLKPLITQRATALAEAVREVLLTDPALEAEELDTGWRELLRAQRGALLGLRRDGVISEEVFEKLTAEVDAGLTAGIPTLPEVAEPSTRFIEITLPPGSPAATKTVGELGLPRAAVLVSIRRGDEIIIPRGDTRLRVGDVVTTLCERECADEVRAALAVGKSDP
ncbi:MAG TPA: Na+/H+ antiporter [Anaerolineales bacterium]|nr:Na+/H+ antiporter [Anaerolineales bacterium]